MRRCTGFVLFTDLSLLTSLSSLGDLSAKALISLANAWYCTALISNNSALWRSFTLSVTHLVGSSCCFLPLSHCNELFLSLMKLSLSFFMQSFILWMNNRQTAIAHFAWYQSEKCSMQSKRVVSTVIFLTSGSSEDS